MSVSKQQDLWWSGPRAQIPDQRHTHAVRRKSDAAVVALCFSKETADRIAAAVNRESAVETLAEALKDMLGWANIQDHHSMQAVQLREKCRAAVAEVEATEVLSR